MGSFVCGDRDRRFPAGRRLRRRRGRTAPGLARDGPCLHPHRARPDEPMLIFARSARAFLSVSRGGLGWGPDPLGRWSGMRMGVSRQSHRLSVSGRSLKGAPFGRVAARWPSATLDRPSRPGKSKTAGKPPKERAGPYIKGRGHQGSATRPGVGTFPRRGPSEAASRVGGAHQIATRSSSLSVSSPSWAGHRPPTGLGSSPFARRTTGRGR